MEALCGAAMASPSSAMQWRGMPAQSPYYVPDFSRASPNFVAVAPPPGLDPPCVAAAPPGLVLAPPGLLAAQDARLSTSKSARAPPSPKERRSKGALATTVAPGQSASHGA